MRRDHDRFKQFSRRAAVLGGVKMLFMSALVGRMYYLQVVERDQYRLLADENRIDLQLLAPPRGRILDRFGALLAGNRQNYQVVLVAERTKDVEETLARLARLIPISENEYARVRRELARKRDFVPVSIRENLSWEQFANVNVNAPYLPGIQPEIGEFRLAGLIVEIGRQRDAKHCLLTVVHWSLLQAALLSVPQTSSTTIRSGIGPA